MLSPPRCTPPSVPPSFPPPIRPPSGCQWIVPGSAATSIGRRTNRNTSCPAARHWEVSADPTNPDAPVIANFITPPILRLADTLEQLYPPSEGGGMTGAPQ